VHLHHPAKALSVSTDNRNELASVCIGHTDSSTETDIPCTRVVITAGPWSTRVFEELFGPSATPPRITSLAGYSLVVKTPNWSEEDEKACFAVFSSGNQGFSPELISRMGGEIYIAGLNSSALPLPNLPTDRQVKTEEIERLKSAAKDIIRVASGSSEFEIIRQEVCFRPVTETGSPMLGRIPDSHLGESITTRPGAEGGVYLAAGHGPWGISLSLGTGKVMAELMQGQDPSAEISQLSP
jgi:glycine/D-amino acid oxidase-like deaminating enzyme